MKKTIVALGAVLAWAVAVRMSLREPDGYVERAVRD